MSTQGLFNQRADSGCCNICTSGGFGLISRSCPIINVIITYVPLTIKHVTQQPSQVIVIRTLLKSQFSAIREVPLKFVGQAFARLFYLVLLLCHHRLASETEETFCHNP